MATKTRFHVFVIVSKFHEFKEKRDMGFPVYNVDGENQIATHVYPLTKSLETITTELNNRFSEEDMIYLGEGTYVKNVRDICDC